MTFINDILTKVWLGLKSLKDERGQDLIEYALLSGVIAIALVALWASGVLNTALSSMASGISNCIDFNDISDCTPGP